jgi:O-antigen/teichoic acid export membrane protein
MSDAPAAAALSEPYDRRPATRLAESEQPAAARLDVEAQTAQALRGLFGRDSIYVVLWGVQLGVAALCTPVITRVLGPVRFGVVASSIAVMQVLVALGGASLQTAVQWQFAKPGGDHGARRLVTLAMVVSGLVFLVADATGPWWCPRLGLGAYGGAVRYAVIWAALTAVSNAALGLIRSRDRLSAFAVVSLMQSVVAEALSLLLVVAVHRTAAEFLLGQAVAQAVAVAIALAVARPALIRRRHARMLGAGLRYSIALVPAALAIFALQAADRLIVQHDLGSAAVARYSIANNIGSLPILLLSVLNAVWLPRVFAVATSSLRRSVLTQSRDALYGLLVPAVIGLAVGAPLVLRVWAPASYRPDGLQLVVALVAIASLPVAGMLAATRVLLVAGSTLAIGLLTLAAGAANIALNIVLVPLLGIAGSALAALASYALLHALLARASSRDQRLPRPRTTLLIKLAVGAAIALAASRLPTTTPFLAARMVIALGCLAAMGTVMLTIVAPKGGSLAARVAALLDPLSRTV